MGQGGVGTLFAGARVDEAVPLAPLTTLRVGPVAPRVITCTSTEQVVATLRHLDAEKCGALLVLAGGSNLVIADTLTDLTVVRLATSNISVDGNIVRAEAGAMWDDVVVTAIAAGLGGLECLSGIPGSAGATPVQNVGAYGAEVADTITRVRLLDRRSGVVRWARAGELGFGYRTSVLKHSEAATVLEVEFALDASGRSAPLRYGELVTALDATAGERANPAAVRDAVLALRARKGMVLDPADHEPGAWDRSSPIPLSHSSVTKSWPTASIARCRTIRLLRASNWPRVGSSSRPASERAIRTSQPRAVGCPPSMRLL